MVLNLDMSSAKLGFIRTIISTASDCEFNNNDTFEKLFILLKFVYKTQPVYKVPLCPSVLKPLSEIAVMERDPSTSEIWNKCFKDVKEYASTPNSLLRFKVALRTSQQLSLHGSGYYFKDSQNTLTLTWLETLILSSLYKLLKSLHKCTSCSPLPQKNLLRSFQFPKFQMIGSLAFVVAFMGLGGCTAIFAQVDSLCV